MRAGDLLLPAWRADPYPLYAALRAAAPVHRSERLDAWVVTRYAEVAAALRDTRLSSRYGTNAFSQVPAAILSDMGPLRRSLKQWALFRDPPDHTRLRALLNRAFLPGLVEEVRPKIRSIALELVRRPLAEGRLEVVHDLAYPLPAIVIAELLGVPAADRDRFKRWSDALAAFLAPGVKTDDHARRALDGWSEMTEYLRRLAADRRAAPRRDLLSALLHAEEHGNLLSEEEVLATVGLLLFAGHETTTNLIANGVLALLRHPGALAELRASPGLVGSTVEEMLRYDCPVQLLARVLETDVTLGGQTLRRGERVIVLLGSANRDPAQFPDPERFLPARRDNRHLAFGFGIHFCLGAALARSEAQEAIGLLAERCPGMRPTGEAIEWQDNLAFRCPRRLPLDL